MLTEKEFEEFYSENYRRIYNYFYYATMSHHTAEDLTSVTFLKFFRSMDRFDENISSKLTFALKIAKNVAVDYFRKNKDHKEVSVGDEEAYEFECNSADRLLLSEILSELPVRDRQVLYYRYYLDMSSEKIAEIMGISLTNATTLCSRALKKAKKVFEKCDKKAM